MDNIKKNTKDYCIKKPKQVMKYDLIISYVRLILLS
jgi:hypothetical protein